MCTGKIMQINGSPFSVMRGYQSYELRDNGRCYGFEHNTEYWDIRVGPIAMSAQFRCGFSNQYLEGRRCTFW